MFNYRCCHGVEQERKGKESRIQNTEDRIQESEAGQSNSVGWCVLLRAVKNPCLTGNLARSTTLRAGFRLGGYVIDYLLFSIDY